MLFLAIAKSKLLRARKRDNYKKNKKRINTKNGANKIKNDIFKYTGALDKS